MDNLDIGRKVQSSGELLELEPACLVIKEV